MCLRNRRVVQLGRVRSLLHASHQLRRWHDNFHEHKLVLCDCSFGILQRHCHNDGILRLRGRNLDAVIRGLGCYTNRLLLSRIVV
jgi:hypothetical protein